MRPQAGPELHLLCLCSRLIAGLAALGMLAACNRQQATATPSPPPPPSVQVVPVVEEQVADRAEYIGRTEAVAYVDLRARVSGFLTARLFEEGSTVREGQLLYVIEQEPYRIAVDIAAASLAQTEATLGNAEKYLARLKAVEDKGGTSQAALEAAEKTVLETRALLEERRARLEQARLDLSYTEIRAPITGRIGRTHVHVGNLVGPESGTLASIIQLHPIWVTFPVSEREFLTLHQNGQDGVRTANLDPTLRLVDGSAYPHEGRLDFEDHRIDPETGTIQLRAVFPNPAFLLRPGQFVVLEQRNKHRTARMVVPQSAIQRDQIGPFVLVVDPAQKAAVRRVTLGEEVGTKWTVLDGLQPGEQVIVDGLQRVTPGSAVNPVTGPAEQQEGASGAQ